MNWEDDIYFQSEFGALYENCELGKIQDYELQTEDGRIRHLFIRRRIPTEDGKEYYDIRTPYGYGGPLLVECKGDRSRLMARFKEDFSAYCLKNHIVSEFIRFHPIADNASDFSDVYDIWYNRKTVATDLQIGANPIEDEFSSGCRKNIRRALNKGVTCRVKEQPDSLAVFRNIYYKTMDRNKAGGYYYFDDAYFEKLLAGFGDKIVEVDALYEDRVIASNISLISGETIYIHLSGTLDEYLSLAPAYILRYGLTQWALDKRFRYIFHGGGRGSGEEDSLYLFKKQFGKKTSFDFYITEKIWNSEGYKEAYRDKPDTETANEYIRRKYGERI